MKRLYHYLRAYPLITILAPLFKMLEATFELFVPLVVAQMIDVGIAQKDVIFLCAMQMDMAVYISCLEKGEDLMLQLKL